MKIPILRGTSGLNTEADPIRIDLDAESVEAGYRGLARAVNVSVTQTGRPGRVKGFSQLASGSYRCLFGEGDTLLAVIDDQLCALDPATYATTSTLKSLTPGSEISYVLADNGRTYWANGYETGYVIGGANYDWEPEDHTRIKSYRDSKKQFASSVPVGTALEFLNGRMYVAVGQMLWISERFFPGLFQQDARFLVFPHDIVMVRAVADGLWVSDKKSIYWVNGLAPAQQTMQLKASYPAIGPNASAVVAPEQIRDTNLLGAGRILKVATTQGICLLGPGGVFVNEFEGTIEHEKSPRPFLATQGAATVFEGAFIATFQP